MPSLPQVNDAHESGHPHDVEENVIHQTRPPSSFAQWSSSDGDVPVVATCGSGHTDQSVEATLYYSRDII